MTVPHNRDGGWLYVGDVLTKALKHDEALAAYNTELSEPGYATWSFKSVLTDRMQNLSSRIDLYANTNASDDPPAAWTAANQCALCHQQ